MGKIGVLASTNGTDMQAIIDAIEGGELKHELVLVANKECGAVERARKHGIPFEIVLSKGREREEFDREVAGVLDREGVDLVLMIGYMRIVTPWFVDKFRNRMMNIHPSLLPAFAGGMDRNVHEAVLEHGCKVTGCTLHLVTEECDEGPIVAQKAVDIEPGETVESLKGKVQKAEQEIILKGIGLFFENRLRVSGRVVEILESGQDL